MTSGTPLAAMGVVVQWSSAFLLLLLFIRLRRSGTNRYAMRTWIAAWATWLLSTAASLVGATGALTGHSGDTATSVHWLAPLAIPGALAFAVLAAGGALDAAGRHVAPTPLRVAVATAVAIGAAMEWMTAPFVAGAALVGTTTVMFWGGAAVVARAERRNRPRRFPLLAAAMAFFGAVTLLYQVGDHFGSLLWPLDDFPSLVGWSGGYASALAAMVLAGALIVLLADDANRGMVSAHPREATPDRAPDAVPLHVAKAADVDLVEVATIIEELQVERPAAVAVVVPISPPAAPIAVVTPAQLPLPRPRTVTLPRPPLREDGVPAEVFVIDDEAAVRATLARVFQRGGWSVRDVSTGEEGLAWLLDVPMKDAPVAILCDFKMPGMGGDDIHAHLLRERPELLGRIVFMAGEAARVAARAFSAGTGCPVVEKPCSVSEIARAVEQLLAPA